MAFVVIELQKEALDRNTRVADLLRKALVVAIKLKHAEFQSWIEGELNGYDKDVPEYRKAWGSIRGYNPYTGVWMPLHFENPKTAERFSQRSTGQSIAEIEDLVGRGKGGEFHMPFSKALQKELSAGFGFQTEVSLFVERAHLVGIVDAVRTIVLNWALKLEVEGILGDEMTFSDSEKKAAQQSPQNINNFYAPIHNAQIAQGSAGAIQVASENIDFKLLGEFVARLRGSLPDLQISEEASKELKSELATLDAQVASPKPKAGIVKESLASLRAILEGASGNAAGQLLIEIAKVFSG